MADPGVTFQLNLADQLFLASLKKNSNAVDDFIDKLGKAQTKAALVGAGIVPGGKAGGGAGAAGGFGGFASAAAMSAVTGVGAAVTAVAATVGAFTVAIRKLMPTMIDWSKAAQSQEEAETQLQAALNATGKSAELNVRDLADYASGLEKVTKFSDEAIISSFKWFAQLRRFPASEIKNAMKLSLDMAEVAGERDPEASVRRLARAIEDPRRATRSLRSAGIMINTQERELIESLDKHGQYAEAVTAILNAVERAVGGAAELQAKTLQGQMSQIKGLTDDLKKFGGYIENEFFRPIASGLRNGLVEWSNYFDGITDGMKKPKDELTKMANEIGAKMKPGQLVGEAMTAEEKMKVKRLTEQTTEMAVLGELGKTYIERFMSGSIGVLEGGGKLASGVTRYITGAPAEDFDLLEESRRKVVRRNQEGYAAEAQLASQREEARKAREEDDRHNELLRLANEWEDENNKALEKAETERIANIKRKWNEFYEHLGRMRSSFYDDTRTEEEKAMDRVKELKQLWDWGYLPGREGVDLFVRSMAVIKKDFLEAGDYLEDIRDLREKGADDQKDLAKLDRRINEKSEFKASIESLTGMWSKIQTAAAGTQKDPAAELKEQRKELAEQARIREQQLNELIRIQRGREATAARFG